MTATARATLRQDSGVWGEGEESQGPLFLPFYPP